MVAGDGLSSDGELANAMPVAERPLAAPALQRFFSPDAIGGVERNRVRRSSGNLFRSTVWSRMTRRSALDYKSSGKDIKRLDEYSCQVEGYRSAAAEAFENRQ